MPGFDLKPAAAGLMVAAALLAGLIVPWILVRMTAKHAAPSRAGETWGCGRILQTARMEYTATAFANPFKRVFEFFYRPVRRLDVDVHPESRFFVRRIEYANPVGAIFEQWLYRPALRALRGVIERLQAVQSGQAAIHAPRAECR